jgi:hypothetical protein
VQPDVLDYIIQNGIQKRVAGGHGGSPARCGKRVARNLENALPVLLCVCPAWCIHWLRRPLHRDGVGHLTTAPVLDPTGVCPAIEEGLGGGGKRGETAAKLLEYATRAGFE